MKSEPHDRIYFDDSSYLDCEPGSADLVENALLRNIRTTRVTSFYGSKSTVVNSKVNCMVRRTAESIAACQEDEEEKQPWE